MLKNNESAADSIEEAIKAVEDFEYYKSVGYGGLPNEEMEVDWGTKARISNTKFLTMDKSEQRYDNNSDQ